MSKANLVTLNLPEAHADTFRVWAEAAGLPLPVLLGALIEHGVIILGSATLKQEPMPCSPERIAAAVDRLLCKLHRHLKENRPPGPPLAERSAEARRKGGRAR